MTRSLRIYREAYLKALENKSPADQKRITARFLSRLVRDRALSKIGQIEKGIRRAHMKNSGRSEIAVESAAQLDPKYRGELERMFGTRALIRETIDPDLVAGARILIDDELLIDATGRKFLRDMFTPLERGRLVRQTPNNEDS